MSTLTAAPDTVLQDGRAVCVIRAEQLEPGDVIIADTAIDITVTSVSQHALWAGFILADYRIGSGEITGQRALVAYSFVCITPRTEEEAH